MSIPARCPACSAKLVAPDAMAGRRARCSNCGGPVMVPAPRKSPARRAREPAAAQAQTSVVSNDSLPVASDDATAALLKLAVVVAMALVLLLTAAILLVDWQPAEEMQLAETTPSRTPVPTQPTAPMIPEPVEPDPPPPPVDPPRTPPPPPPRLPPLEPLPQESAPAREEARVPPRTPRLPPELQEKVNRAIDRGVVYLKEAASGTHEDEYLHKRGGADALVGLTLLTCGIPADDPVIRRLQAQVRSSLLRAATGTYDLSLAVLFLDRLGDPNDRDLIRSGLLRLIAGQNLAGGWGYNCPFLQEADELELLEALRSLPAAEDYVALKQKEDSGRTRSERPAERGRVAELDRDRARPALRSSGPLWADPSRRLNLDIDDDNSNTQFAVLAVWAGQRYDIPIDRSMALVEARFRATQFSNGSWGYHKDKPWQLDSMTCAGLLGLAVGRGTFGKPETSQQPDAGIAAGLAFLAGGVGRPEKPPGPRVGGRGAYIGADSLGDLYYLWSLERVAVAYDLQEIGGKDWYRWGAEILVNRQRDDGSWSDVWRTAPDTCFALLFLKRANVAQDLTGNLRKLDKLIDHGAIRRKED